MIAVAEELKVLVTRVFAAAGCQPSEAERIGHYLVESNLVGHDSHGVIRVPDYIAWLRAGKVIANRTAEVVFESDAFAVLEGHYGFGQVLGEQATALAIEKSARHGLAAVGLRNSGHLGRIGDWAEMCARAGRVSLHFVNTTGGGILVAPFGGTQRRLSANPIAAGVPGPGGNPIVLDISTSIIAEGKIKVARNRGTTIPEGYVLDGHGQPTCEPKEFYGPPPGAILPFGGHKGYGLSVITEILAGALCAGWCSNPVATRVSNNMLSIVFDPSVVQPLEAFASEIERFVAHVKSSKTIAPDGEILMPGEVEARLRAQKLRDGIELDETTWNNLLRTAEEVGAAV